MSSWKCMNCGIINFASAQVCRRCQGAGASPGPATLYASTDYSQAPGYGAPAMNWSPSNYAMDPGIQMAGVWRQGKKLVMHKQAYLPDRCVKCNAPTQGQYLHRKLSWLHPAWALLILASWIIYLIVYLAIRKQAEVDIGLCERHLADRKMVLGLSWAAALSGIGCFIVALGSQKPGFILLGIMLLVAGVIFGSYAANVVSVTRIDDQYIWLRRVSEDYLANFPSA